VRRDRLPLLLLQFQTLRSKKDLTPPAQFAGGRTYAYQNSVSKFCTKDNPDESNFPWV
jgi:hypothetical protein